MENALYKGNLVLATNISKIYDFEKQVRKASTQKELICPDPDCNNPILRYCHGDKKNAYFAHLNNSNCDYAIFDKANTSEMKTVRRKVYEHFKSKGFNVQPEVKVLEHHYTHLLFKINDRCIALEIGDNKTSYNYINNLSSQYSKRGIEVKWLVIGNIYMRVIENKSCFLKRYLLNESKNKDLIVISNDGTKISQYKCDPNSYLYNGQEMYSKNYPVTYVKTAPINALTFNDNELGIPGFDRNFENWITKKNKAFHKTISIIKEKYQQEKEVIKEKTQNLTSNKKMSANDISYDERRKEILPQLSQQITQARDSLGIRWVKCELCGEINIDAEFNYYGGKNRVNLGYCKKCLRNRK